MGNPVQATKEFPGLAHAADEMKTVAGRFKPSGETIHARGDATPEAYDASKPAQFRFLHFVTHGTASDLNPLESAIVLSRGKDGFKLYAEDVSRSRSIPSWSLFRPAMAREPGSTRGKDWSDCHGHSCARGRITSLERYGKPMTKQTLS